jgi:hypothetical protein
MCDCLEPGPIAARMGAENGKFFREAAQRLDEGVDLAAGLQLIEPSKAR